MDTFHSVVVIVLAFIQAHQIRAQCLRGCSCVTDRHGSSLVCMEDSPFEGIPKHIPEDVTKIRIERSHFTEIPRGAFSKTTALEHLWLNFNDITLMDVKSLEGLGNLAELRLQGNKLRSVPWTAFEDTPALKILDLKHNRIDALPENALKSLPGLTYLDLSFNQLTVVSKDVFLNWAVYQKIQSGDGEEGESTGGVVPNVVLALHDNAWLCDCRLKGFVEFIRSLSSPVILMNSYLTCSGPNVRAGKFFHEVELKTCVKPVASIPATNLTMPLGANLTLSCLAKARPDPVVWWTYGLKLIRGFHEFQERADKDTICSRLVIPALRLEDRGLYTCTANNFLGSSDVSVILDVRSPEVLWPPSLYPHPGAPAVAEESVYVDVRITRQTVYGVTVAWYAHTERPSETWFTVHFGRVDDPKKETVHVGPGINSYSVSDLTPATKYAICVAVKSQSPRTTSQGQCVVFVTGSDVNELEQRAKLIQIVVVVCAMVLAVPAGMYACTTDAKLNCLERLIELRRSRRRGADMSGTGVGERQGTFDSLQAASDEGLCKKDSSEDRKVRRRSEDRLQKVKGDHSRLTAELY